MKSLKLVRVLIAENDFGKVFAEKCLFLGNSSRKPEMPCGVQWQQQRSLVWLCSESRLLVPSTGQTSVGAS